MKWIKTRNWIKKRIVVILGMELILLTVCCYAIGTETTAYNRKIAFDAKKVAFTMKDAVVPVKTTVKETKAVIESQEDQSLTEGKTVVFADRYLGNPYVLGGRDIETGVDCAGFVNYVFTHGPAGKHWKSMNVGGLYHEIGGKSVSVDKMKPGDIIFFGSGLSHVAIYAGNGQIVHAMDEANGICRTKLFRANGSTYSGKKIVDVRRVL